MSKGRVDILKKWLAVIVGIMTLLVMLMASFVALTGLTCVFGFLIRVVTSAFLIGWQGAGNYLQP